MTSAATARKTPSPAAELQLTIEKEALLKPLSHVQSIVERRNTIPILSNVLISAEDGQFSLTATDMDIDIIESTKTDVTLAGAVTVPAHTFHDIVRKLPDGAQIELKTEPGNGRMIVRAGRSTFNLATLPMADFPTLNNVGLSHEFTVSAALLRSLIDRTRFAISTEETRYYLNGIYLHVAESENGEVLRAVATDGHRLAQVELPIPQGAAGMPGVILPRKTVNELRKLIEETLEDVTIALSDTKIQFTFDNVILTSKLIDGTFPDYQRVIPEGNDKSMQVPTVALTAAVDRVAIISTEKSRAIKMVLEKNNLAITANSPDSGSAREELEVDYNNAPIEIGFNARYVLDVTQQIKGNSIEFMFAETTSPTLVRDPSDASALYVIMPMRV